MIIGGAKYKDNSNPIEASNKTWFYRIRNHEWHPGPELNHPRFGHSCGVIGNKITKRK